MLSAQPLRSRDALVRPGGRAWATADGPLPKRIWIAAALTLFVPYLFMFSVVHPLVDLRVCVARLPDPLFRIIPQDSRWYLVSVQLFMLITAGAALGLLVNAVRGQGRPMLRWMTALGIQASFRCVTLALLPLCYPGVVPGHATATSVPHIDLGFVRFPFHPFATSDMVFSGHVGEFLTLSWAAAGWRRPLRWGLGLFQVVQVYALLATRGHYTFDILVAVPCAYLADRLALAALARLTPRSSARSDDQAPPDSLAVSPRASAASR